MAHNVDARIISFFYFLFIYLLKLPYNISDTSQHFVKSIHQYFHNFLNFNPWEKNYDYTNNLFIYLFSFFFSFYLRSFVA